MHWTVLLLMFLGLPALAGPCEPADQCGLSPAVIPDFTLTDVNPNSVSLGTELSRDDLLGEYLILYFAQST